MNKRERINILKKAQETQTAPQVQHISLGSIPGFRRELFNAKPNIVNNIEQIVNIINKYLVSLSGGKVTFNIVWNNPSVTGSQFHDDAKHLVTMSKWIYNVIKSQTPMYTLGGLQEFANNFVRMVQTYPLAAAIKGELQPAGANLLAVLGPQAR